MTDAQAKVLYGIGAPHLAAFYAVVVLGRVLSMVPGGWLTATTDGPVPVAEGRHPYDVLSSQLAHVLASPLRELPRLR